MPHLGIQYLLYVHYDPGSHSKNIFSQIKFISTQTKDTTSVRTLLVPTPTQKLDLHEKEFKIDPKASFIQIIQRDLYEMVILDFSWLHKGSDKLSRHIRNRGR